MKSLGRFALFSILGIHRLGLSCRSLPCLALPCLALPDGDSLGDKGRGVSRRLLRDCISHVNRRLKKARLTWME